MSKTRSLPVRRYLSQQEVAETLGVTDRTVRNMIRRGDLPAVRLTGSRLVRVNADDIEKMLRPIPTVDGDVA